MSLAVLLAISIAGCAEPASWPELHTTPLTEDDIEVLSAAVHAEGRNRGSTASPVLLASDRTIRACAPPDYVPLTYECIEMEELLHAEHIVRGLFGEAGVTLFQARNRAATTVGGSIRGVRVAPGREVLDLLDERGWPLRLRRHYPGVSGVVLFTAPVYPLPRESVAYVLRALEGASLVHLVRSEGGWTVRKVYRLWPVQTAATKPFQVRMY